MKSKFELCLLKLYLKCILDYFRIYVDLPDAENRVKILRIFLAKENVEPEFQFGKLADATEGYSGSDLKVIS